MRGFSPSLSDLERSTMLTAPRLMPASAGGENGKGEIRRGAGSGTCDRQAPPVGGTSWGAVPGWERNCSLLICQRCLYRATALSARLQHRRLSGCLAAYRGQLPHPWPNVHAAKGGMNYVNIIFRYTRCLYSVTNFLNSHSLAAFKAAGSDAM